MNSQRPAITIRPMRPEDIPFGMKLSQAAGWNQGEADWNLLFEQGAGGCLVACYQGVLAGTVSLISYQDRFHWVGMMLVATELQRQGIGRALLTAAFDQVMSGETVFLDATPTGKKLYDSLGFQEVYGLARCIRQKGPASTPPKIPARPISKVNLLDLSQFDSPIFGANRSNILAMLYQRAPQLAFYTEEDSAINGYCLGRTGRQYTQIGPLAADRLETAQRLLLTALQNCTQQDVILDTTFHQSGWNQFLSGLGFRELRPFTRMRLGGFEFPELHCRQFAIAGPEIG
jgi:GNAT superfamily N-acetyltransferase